MSESDLTEEELAEVVGIEYVGEDGAPEESPSLMVASDLLPPEDDPLSSLPVEEPDADTPPDDAVPPFLVTRNKFGPGAHGVYLADGMPVGVFLDRVHHDLTGAEVTKLLSEMGLEDDLAEWYGKQRDGRIAAERELMQNPDVQMEAAQDIVRTAQKKAIQDAFVKAQKGKV